MARVVPDSSDARSVALRVGSLLMASAIIAVASGMVGAQINKSKIEDHARRIVLLEQFTFEVIRVRTVQEELVRKIERIEIKLDKILNTVTKLDSS